MIGFVLGTSEGKEILKKINTFTDDIVISTATSYGGELLKAYKFKHLNTNPLDEDGFINLAKEFKIKAFVDASHPYAKDVSKTLMDVCTKLDIKYIRYERLSYFKSIKNEDYIYIDSYLELEDVLKNIKGNVLNTTGSNNVPLINSLNIENRVIHRILPSPKILQKIIDCGVKIDDIIAIKGPFKRPINDGILKEYEIKAIITKDSGEEGGVKEKVESAIEHGSKVIIINKPSINYGHVFNNIDDMIEFIKFDLVE